MLTASVENMLVTSMVQRWKLVLYQRSSSLSFRLSADSRKLVSNVGSTLVRLLISAWVYISALALFFIIGWVASFKVIPTCLNNMVPAMFPLLETVLELTFRDGLEYARRIIFKRRFVIESLSFEWLFEFWKQPKVTGGYVGTVRRLSKQCDTVFTQKLLHKIR